MKNIAVRNFLDFMNHQLKYVVKVTLMNGTKMSFLVSASDFPDFKKWFSSAEHQPTTDYLITKPNGLVRLNQKDILELTYKPITTGNQIIYQLAYVFFKPIPQAFNIFSFVKLLMVGLFSIIGWFYFNKYNVTVEALISPVRIWFSFLIAIFCIMYVVFALKGALDLLPENITGEDDIRYYGISVKNANALCLNMFVLWGTTVILHSVVLSIPKL